MANVSINGVEFDVRSPDEIYYDGVKRKFYTIQTRWNKYKVFQYYTDKQKHMYVHRVIATAFVPNPENKPIVIHLDGDTLNNSIENLAWANYTEKPKPARSHYFREGECKECGKRIVAFNEDSKCLKDGLCKDCRRHAPAKQRAFDRAVALDLAKRYMDSHPYEERNELIYKMRTIGVPYRVIGNYVGLSYERCRTVYLDMAAYRDQECC